MNLLDFFLPRKINFPDSKYNKNISILKYLNSSTLVVDGLVESGDVMTRVWKKGITSFLPKSFKPQKVLILGLAGGCNARLVNQYFPKASISAVEIDPSMIKLGKKYFYLSKIKNLEIVIDDALSYVNNLQNSDIYDLVMVDCFVGRDIPKKLQSPEFFKKLKKHSRFVLVNRVWWYGYKKASLAFFRSISLHFFFIKTHTPSNVIISLV
jgi:spermidine synthase